MNILSFKVVGNQHYLHSSLKSCNGSFQLFPSAAADVLAQHNPAYITKEDIHTYDYIPADGMILTRADQCPPHLPPDRNVQEEDQSEEGKS